MFDTNLCLCQALKELQIEREKFERYKKTEMDSLTAHRDEEMRKLKKERKLFETYRQETLGKPGKKERQEIEDLKQEVSSPPSSNSMKCSLRSICKQVQFTKAAFGLFGWCT